MPSSGGAPSIARRRHVRVPVDIPVYVYAGREERRKSQALDVSLSGMRLTGAGLQRDGAKVYLEYALPHHRDYPVMAIGRVIWTRGSGEEGCTAGVEVTRYFPSARFAIRSFMERSRRRQVNYNLFDEA